MTDEEERLRYRAAALDDPREVAMLRWAIREIDRLREEVAHLTDAARAVIVHQDEGQIPDLVNEELAGPFAIFRTALNRIDGRPADARVPVD